MSKRMGRIMLTNNALHDLLRLPAWMTIEQVVSLPGDYSKQACSVLVRGRFLPECADGMVPQTVTPRYTLDKDCQPVLATIDGLDT